MATPVTITTLGGDVLPVVHPDGRPLTSADVLPGQKLNVKIDEKGRAVWHGQRGENRKLRRIRDRADRREASRANRNHAKDAT